MSAHTQEVMTGARFRFGANWQRYLEVVDEDRIRDAERSLRDMLGCGNLHGSSFLDVGSGSGLFSLAARRLGATVRSFDFDPDSVACTTALRRRYFPDDPGWLVDEGSVLDTAYLDGLGRFDIVYAWGVLHHTGAMWQALHNVASLVAPGGMLFISVYNDQGFQSRLWHSVKRRYNRSSPPLRACLLLGSKLYFESKPMAITLAKAVLGRQSPAAQPARRERGMSRWHDLVDWVGGYPFEVAKPEEVFQLYAERGFELRRLKTCGGGLGCNEFVFVGPEVTARASIPGRTSTEHPS
jgi:2-polyprenyl-3-methyl-5-hydroxy-6-metoxy-1,4-benzoquinol methylase